MITVNQCVYKILSVLIKNTKQYVTGRKLTYDIEHYVKIIYDVLITGQQWNTITDKLHYTVYHKHYINWCRLGIFNELYQIVLKMKTQLKKINKNCYVDSTIIRNICGIEDANYTYKIKSKKGTKVSIIVNSKGIPLSIHTTNSNYSDVSLVLPSYMKINKNIKIENLIGDKGYVSNKIKTYFKEKYNINYVYPEKGTIINTDEDNKLVKSRYINENSFSWLTKYRRLTCRYEKITLTFHSFIQLAYVNIMLNKK